MANGFTPPEPVSSAARRGLRLATKVGGIDKAALKRATALADRKPHTLADVGRLVSRHAMSAAQRPANVGTDSAPSAWLVGSLLMGGDAGKAWAAGVWRRNGSEAEASRLGLARTESALALSREVPPPPEGMAVHNPKGLHVGKAFRVLTADEVVRDGSTGESLGCFPVETLGEFVRVFEARCERGEGAPRIDYNHGPSRGMDPTLFGAVVACYVGDDGERGPGLYVVPGWTDYGRDFIAKHATPDGGSVLSNSPEFAVGPVYARGGGDAAEVGDLLGGAELFGVALTGSPQQSEAIIDAVRLSRDGQGTAYAAGEASTMDPNEERIAALEAAAAEQSAKLDKLLAAVESLSASKDEMVAEVVDAAGGEVSDLIESQGEAMLAAAVTEAEVSAEPGAVEMADGMLEEEDVLLCRKPIGTAGRIKALSRRLKAINAAKRALGNQTAAVKQFAKRLEAQEAETLSAKCSAAMAELRTIGMSAGEEPKARELWMAKHGPNASAFAKMFTASAHPYDDFVSRVKANPSVPRGVRGVPGELQTGGGPTIADVKAWAKSNGHDYDKNPAGAAMAWTRATGHDFREVVR